MERETERKPINELTFISMPLPVFSLVKKYREKNAYWRYTRRFVRKDAREQVTTVGCTLVP